MLTTVVTLVYACLCNVALDGVTADSEEKRRSVWHVVGGILYLDVCIHTHTLASLRQSTASRRQPKKGTQIYLLALQPAKLWVAITQSV